MKYVINFILLFVLASHASGQDALPINNWGEDNADRFISKVFSGFLVKWDFDDFKIIASEELLQKKENMMQFIQDNKYLGACSKFTIIRKSLSKMSDDTGLNLYLIKANFENYPTIPVTIVVITHDHGKTWKLMQIKMQIHNNELIQEISRSENK